RDLCLCALSLLILVGYLAPASAQGAGRASIIGQVTDESGSVLPGVSISARSSALQVPDVTVITDASGQYRLVELPAGSYVVTYNLLGFQNVQREDIRLSAGFIAKLDIVLKIGT